MTLSWLTRRCGDSRPHPLLDGPRLICMVGGSNSAVVALTRTRGKEVWRALTAKEVGYAPPILHTIGGKRQIVICIRTPWPDWNRRRGSALDAQVPGGRKAQRPEVTIATPRVFGDRVFVSSFYHGSLLLQSPMTRLARGWFGIGTARTLPNSMTVCTR